MIIEHKGGENIRKQTLLILITLLLAIILSGTVSAADGDIIYVNGSSGLDTNDGFTPGSAKLTIKNATETVSSNGVVSIADGVYSGTGNTNITINRNMTIHGQNPAGTIINGTDTNWIFSISSGVNVTIQNLILTNGITYDGGAILNNGILSISNCTFTKNTATHWGGAIYSDSYQSIMSLTDCTFTKNNALYGGGAIAYLNICNVTNCTFLYNSVTGETSWCGGAIGAYSLSNSTVTGCTFIGNSVDSIPASFGGGAIYVYNAALTANFNRFYNNSARLGSAFVFNNVINSVINAENNWWGSNVDPTTVPNLIIVSNPIFGYVDANPWVILTVNATPTTIYNGETSSIIADLNHINGGSDLIGGKIPEGPITLDVPWGSFTNSGISHSLTEDTVAGVMSATFYASEGALNPLFNPVQVSATADEYTTTNTESAYITINPLANLAITKTANKTRPNLGEAVQFTIVTRNNGPSTANNLIVTDTLPIGLDFINCTGSGVWDPVTRTVTWPAAVVLNGANVTYYLTALVNSTSLAGKNVTNVVNETHNEYPNNSTTNCTLYVPKADLYIQITSNKNNPKVGETFTLTYKLGNNGPDNAQNVTITIPLPEGFVISKIKGDGNWTQNGNTITWTFNNVTVGDPYLYITGRTTKPGTYQFTASIASDTYNINSSRISSISLNSVPQVNATTTHTIRMQNTGIPLAGIVLAILMVLGGFITTHKKQ